MGRSFWTVALIGLMVFVAGMVSAQPANQAEAKLELEKLEKVHAFAKDTVVQVINCYVQHQPYLQNMYGDYPERGREHVVAMNYCVSRYTGTVEGAPKLVEIRDRAIAIMKRDIDLGDRYCDNWRIFNEMKETNAKQEKMDEQKKVLEAMKQELFKNASEFAQVQKEFQDWQKNFNAYFATVRNMALGKK